MSLPQSEPTFRMTADMPLSLYKSMKPLIVSGGGSIVAAGVTAIEHGKFIERRVNGRYWIVSPGDDDEGMGLEYGPFLTRGGARWHLRVWG